MKRILSILTLMLFAVLGTTAFAHGFHITPEGLSLAGSSLAVTVLPIDRQRLALQLIRDLNLGRSASPSYLRIDQAIVNGQNQYDFNPNANPGSDYKLERKVNKNDVFIITNVMMYLYSAVSGLRTREVLQTYPNATYFASGSTFRAYYLNAFYQGSLQYVQQQTQYVPAIDTRRYYWVPDTLQGTTTAAATPIAAAAGASPVTAYTQALSPSRSKDFSDAQDPFVFLNGNQENHIYGNVPLDSTDVPANDVANTTNYWVYWANGYLIKGAVPQYEQLLENAYGSITPQV